MVRVVPLMVQVILCIPSPPTPPIFYYVYGKQKAGNTGKPGRERDTWGLEPGKIGKNDRNAPNRRGTGDLRCSIRRQKSALEGRMTWGSSPWWLFAFFFLSSIDRQHTKSGSLRGRQAPFAGVPPDPESVMPSALVFRGSRGAKPPPGKEVYAKRKRNLRLSFTHFLPFGFCLRF
jgi:hypothetical protein